VPKEEMVYQVLQDPKEDKGKKETVDNLVFQDHLAKTEFTG
jgi:hypothetical protein